MEGASEVPTLSTEMYNTDSGLAKSMATVSPDQGEVTLYGGDKLRQ
jgi:hypothetical protein